VVEIANKVVPNATVNDNFEHAVQVNWHIGQGNLWWNETCDMVLEVFGLPGQRFMYTPHEDYMVFKFKTEQDKRLCQILLSDRI
jgi:hypothetical protein